MTISQPNAVYEAAISFACRADDLIEHLPRAEHLLVEQLTLASIQLPARIAESTLEGSDEEARANARSDAHGVAARCAALLDLLEHTTNSVANEELSRARGALTEVAAMLAG